MKPSKNKVFCKDIGRTKMLFETEKKADNFIKFNQEEIETESGYSPQRSYFCLFCGGWHITSIRETIGKSKNEKLIEKYLTEKANNQEKRNKLISKIENEIKGMHNSQMEIFLTGQINLLKKEIEDLIKPANQDEKEKLKELRQELEIIYAVRKQNGFHKTNSSLVKIREREFEEWKLWLEKKV